MSFLMTSVVALMAGQPVQTPSTQSATSNDEVIHLWHPRYDEIIVVRGRTEWRNAMPGAASAIRPENITTLDQLATAAPGVWLINDQDPGTNILSIRGATTDRLQQASVAVVLDGVPLADTELFTGALFDLNRIEVLRGPQGALFGKNAAGGVIGITTEAGSNTYASAGAGNGGAVQATVAWADSNSGPSGLLDNWRLVVHGRHADGWITNRTLNRLVDETGTGAVRFSSGGSIGPGVWNIKAHWMQEEGGAAWASSNNVTGLNGGVLDGAVLTDPIGDYEGRSWRHWTQVSARYTMPLARGELSLLAARDSYRKRWDEELDYRPGALTFFGFPAFPNGIQPISQPITIRATTGEARWNFGRHLYQTDGSPQFKLTLGAFVQDTSKDRVDEFGPLLFGADAPAYQTGSLQMAVFGGVSVPVWDRAYVEAQVRFDRDDRYQTITNSRTGAVLSDRDAVFDRTQSRLALGWQSDAGLSLWVSRGDAFRPGGFNPQPGADSIWSLQYRPEITTAFEAGLRYTRGRNAWLALSLYHNDVRDWQNYTFIDGQSVTLNVPEVTNKGIEIEGRLAAAGFDLTASGAWLDARIGRFIATDPLLGSPATRNYTGRRLPNAPRFSGNVTVQRTFDAGDISVTPALTVHHAGTTWYEIDNVLRSPARSWADVSLTVQFPDDWSLSVLGENITNERWAVSAFGQGMTGLLAGLGPGGPFDTFTINRGAVWKVELRRDF
jgi:iron complex outermembrane recepter protein